ncbi:hypothetical protein [Salimicrobium flavidum]|uniref:Uncharacterized protein n=1 Tax=Salimicrobium flavidum TaxID=570947 RepID=A0A1N7II71_9BACI|nr:hypothetical protein [Salimicrobium flavidum]SIS36814.1 hypothetical protein SAMN05421687_10181 [Salimicrobium flavidum]
MQEFISAIFSNIFILGAILYGVFSLIRFASGSQDREEGGDALPSSSKSREPSSTLQEQYEQAKEATENSTSGDSIGVEDPHTSSHDGILSHGDLVVDRKESEKKEVHPFLREKWTKKRLGDGVIMREILGPPRSKSPHYTSKRWR